MYTKAGRLLRRNNICKASSKWTWSIEDFWKPSPC